MTVDLMFLAKDRLEFTQESLRALRANTNWSLVDEFVIYDDGSTDGTLEFLREQAADMNAELRQTQLGSAVAAQNHFIERSRADFAAKCDNDAMFPPRWLDISLDVLTRFPELGVLCLEERGIKGEPPYGYQHAAEGDGLFVARRSIFDGRPAPNVIRKYWGWETWIRQNKIKLGWLAPSIPVFLLDRVPIDPWRAWSWKYEQRGWQRPLGGAVQRYSMDRAYLWSWCGWGAPGGRIYRAAKPLRVAGGILAPGTIVPAEWSVPCLIELENRGLIKSWSESQEQA